MFSPAFAEHCSQNLYFIMIIIKLFFDKFVYKTDQDPDIWLLNFLVNAF